MSTCSRTGCTKKLNANNRSGACATGCLSPEAPASVRAKGKEPAAIGTPPQDGAMVASTGALARFRTVAEALGFEPDDILEEFAQEWLNGLKAKLTEEA